MEPRPTWDEMPSHAELALLEALYLPGVVFRVYRRLVIGHVYSVLLTALRSFTISSNRYQTSLPL
jgi:hypothetical protein